MPLISLTLCQQIKICNQLAPNSHPAQIIFKKMNSCFQAFHCILAMGSLETTIHFFMRSMDNPRICNGFCKG